MPDFLLDAFGDRHVVARVARRANIGLRAARRDADEIDAFAFERLGDGHGVVRRQTAFAPVYSGNARPERHGLRHHGAHRARNGQGKAHAVREAAAILIGALVGQRRDEAVHQIAVRHVQFDLIEADAQRALRRGNEGLAHAVKVRLGRLARHVPAFAPGQRRRAESRPRILSGLQRLGAFPRALRGCLAPGVRKLDAELGGARPPALRDDALKRELVVVGIKPHAAVGDAALPLDMRRLDDDQRGAGIGQHAEMHHVPVIGAAVVGGILAHRRDDDAVCKFEACQLHGRKQGTGHGQNSGDGICRTEAVSAAGWI